MEKFSKLDQNQRTSTTNMQSQLKVVVGHLSKGRSARFAITVSYFLRASNENCCQIEATGKRVNSGNREGLQIPCILHFSGEAKFVSKLEYILPKLM